MDTKGLQKEFINWCKSKNKLPKSEDETKLLFVAFMKEKHPEEYKAAMENQQKQQTTKALHGAKLNYFKSLKNQCAEDEEVVYYKKGGRVGCGCKKKEDGGEVTKAKKGTVVDEFKNRKPVPNLPTLEKNPGSTKQPMLDALKRKYHKNNYSSKAVKESQKDYDKGKGDHEVKKCGGKVKKDCGGSKLKACNRAVTKFKMHRLGGSLNGIPFYLGGTPKGGVLYRFRRSTNNMNNGYKTYSDLIMMTQDPLGYPTYDAPPISAGRTIYVTPLGNDTIFYTNNDILNKTPKGDLNLKKAKLKFYQLIKKAPIEGEEYRMTPYWNSNLFNLDMIRNRALKGN